MKNKKSGFTLVEIMIVVMIIGLLAAIAIPGFANARKTAQTNACIENLRQLNGAVQQYMMAQATTNAPTAFTDLDVYFQNAAPTTGPAGGAYSLPATGSDVPTCPVADHVLSN
jgi:prepilin-type N-terminal cleavage/methylation domain-containing protein